MKFNQTTTTVVQGRFTGTCCRLATFYQWDNQPPLLPIHVLNLASFSKTATQMIQATVTCSEAEIDPDLSGAHPFSRRNRTDVPSGQALSSTADETPLGWQRPRNRADRQDALLTIAWASRQCMLAQLLTRRPYDRVAVEYSSDHLSVSSCLVTSQLAWFS